MGRTCKSCGLTFQATGEFFYIRKNSGRIDSHCKECRKRKTAAFYQANKASIRIKVNHKYKTDPEFREKKQKTDSESYLKNKDKRLKQYKKYRNQPDVIKRNKEYFKKLRENPDFIEQKKKYLNERHNSLKHDEDYKRTRREAFKNYYRLNKDKYRVHVIKRRSKLASAEGSFTPGEFNNLLVQQQFKCFWCDTDISEGKATVDHLHPISKGGSNYIQNIVGACGSCNSSKGAKLPEEFIELII